VEEAIEEKFEREKTKAPEWPVKIETK